MEIERRLLSYIAMLIATIFYCFGRAEAASPELPTVSGQSCQQPDERAAKMIACKPGQTK
jgi:hypothetical protein